jgi:LysR family transcriptional regulator, glycine cleavage system transcriptional activator
MNTSKLRRLPSSSALLGFATVARTLSLARAAEILSLSPSAVSKQLREIESFVGCALFERSTRVVKLTPEGALYAESIDAGLSRIEEATLTLRTKRSTATHIDIAVSPTFCNRWLIPRLATFYAEQPAITLNLQTAVGVPDLRGLRVDCAISFCGDADATAEGELVMPLDLILVCAPKLLGARYRRQWQHAVTDKPLLGQQTLPSLWEDFFSKNELNAKSIHESARYQLLSMGHQACLVGLGIALLPEYVVAEDLRAGRLIRLGDIVYRAQGSYRLIAPTHATSNAAYVEFRRWLLRTAH